MGRDKRACDICDYYVIDPNGNKRAINPNKAISPPRPGGRVKRRKMA